MFVTDFYERFTELYFAHFGIQRLFLIFCLGILREKLAPWAAKN